VEAVRLETGFIYIKVVVVTARKNCGKTVKVLFRAFISLWGAVGNTALAVGKGVRYYRHQSSPFFISLNQSLLPT
jgi:hypothetical protein